MRILILLKSFHPSLSGTDHMAIDTAQKLSSRYNHHVRVVHSSKTVSSKKYSINGLAAEIIPQDYEQAIETLLPYPFDIIHLFDCTNKLYLKIASQISKIKNIPLIVTPATDACLWEDINLGMEVCHISHHVITLTPIEKQAIISQGRLSPKQISVIPHSPFLAANRSSDCLSTRGVSSDDPIVLFLGRKVRDKGYHYILRASEDVWKYHPRTRFIFAGPVTNEFKEDIFYHRDKRIIDLGEVTEEEKHFLLQACRFVCLPSNKDVFPLVFLEAWSYGKPVIGSPIFKDFVIRDEIDGVIVENKSDKLSKSIRRLLDYPELCVKMGNNGQKRVYQDHNSNKSIELINKIYHKCINN